MWPLSAGRLGNYKFGVCAFFDYAGEPIAEGAGAFRPLDRADQWRAFRLGPYSP
jgi:hypothetical protein